MKKLGFWVVFAILAAGYLAGGKDDKSPARAPAPKASSFDSNVQSYGLAQAPRTQHSTDTPPPVAKQPPFVVTTMYVAQRANMRAEPSTKSQIITVIDKGQLVKVLNV